MATDFSDGIIQKPVDRWILNPMRRFILKSSTGGIILFSAAILAMVIANSPYGEAFHHFWETEFSIGFNGKVLSKSLHHWINDGLMAVFFFVVGLELKREIMAGELSSLSKAALPVAAAIGGMLFPALIYLLLNPQGEASAGWGVPMATDIAFALGILYLLGDRVPLTLKVFLTALAIADDIGAVLVIAFFYTSEIDMNSLLQAAFYLGILLVANRMGVRSTAFYAIIGIGGVWLAFLVSGVHATIAAVLIAFTIPATVKVKEDYYSEKMDELLAKFKEEEPNRVTLVTDNQLHIIEDIRDLSKKALTPLQRLEHGMHPFVSYFIMPVFALANAGVKVEDGIVSQLTSPVSLGVILGLLIGKFAGIMLFVTVLLKLGWARLPDGMNRMHLTGGAMLAGIGFTMSLFISELAFTDERLIAQARLGILAASLVASLIGYAIIHRACRTGDTQRPTQP
jgi:NhaA family Na+:H+ antiporter